MYLYCYSIVGSGAFCCWIGLDKFAPNMMELLVFARFAPRPNQAVKKNRSTTSIECIMLQRESAREREEEGMIESARDIKTTKEKERERACARERERKSESEREREREFVRERKRKG